MEKYEVETTETLQRIVTIHANDEDDALRKVKEMYRAEEIILDSHDYIDTEISLYQGLRG